MTNTRSPSTVTAIRPRWVLALTSIAYLMVVLDSLVVITAQQPSPLDSGRPCGPASPSPYWPRSRRSPSRTRPQATAHPDPADVLVAT